MDDSLTKHRDELALVCGIIMFFLTIFILPVTESYFSKNQQKGYFIGGGILVFLIFLLALIDPKFSLYGSVGVSIESTLFFIALKWGD